MDSVTTPQTVSRHLADLRELLDAEAEALATANYGVMDDLAERKGALMEVLNPETLEAEDVDGLRQQAARNARLFEATLGGLRTVINRLNSVARASAHLDTYTATGVLQDLGPARSSFEKRS